MSKVYQLVCLLNCWDSCGFLVIVEDGKVIKVDGDLNYLIMEGKICGCGRMFEIKINLFQWFCYLLKK